ncbi:MAG: hypothetical protein RL208_431 [Pseudomonadota bacterium]|jgi:hypothetical protein
MKIILKYTVIFVLSALVVVMAFRKNPQIANKILSFSYNKQKEEQTVIKKTHQNSIVESEEKMNYEREVIRLKEELLTAKSIPDTRKDIVDMLISIRDIERNIGKNISFSDNLIQIFYTTAKMPSVNQEIVDYQNKFRDNLYNFATNDLIMRDLEILNNEIIAFNYDNDIKDKNFAQKAFVKMKYKMLQKNKNINTDEFEKTLLDHNYKKLVNILEQLDSQIKKLNSYNNLYTKIDSLLDLQIMIDKIYLSVATIDTKK